MTRLRLASGVHRRDAGSPRADALQMTASVPRRAVFA